MTKTTQYEPKEPRTYDKQARLLRAARRRDANVRGRLVVSLPRISLEEKPQ